MPRVLAVDIGTSRIKAALFDEKGNMEALADRRLERADSPSRQDARMWYESVCLLLRSMDLTRRIPDAVALTGNMHALLGIGPDGVLRYRRNGFWMEVKTVEYSLRGEVPLLP